MANTAKKGYPKVCHDLGALFSAEQTRAEMSGKAKPPPGTKAKKVQSLGLIVNKAQWVKFADRYFHLRKEGLYRFWDWGKVRYDRARANPKILDDGRDYASVILFRGNIPALFGAVATLQVHGHYHDKLSYKRRIERLKCGSLSLTCGDIAKVMCGLLGELGYQSRIIRARRTEGTYNTYDNGHVLFEFYWPKYRKWVLADVDCHQMFVKNGSYLNGAEVRELLESGRDFELAPLTPPGVGRADTTESVISDFSGFRQFEHMFYETEALMQWYRLMFATMYLEGSEGMWYFYCADARARRRACEYDESAVPIDKRQWLQRFYR